MKAVLTDCYKCICLHCNERCCPYCDKCTNCYYPRFKRKPRLDCDFFSSKRRKVYKYRKGLSKLYYSVYVANTLVGSHMTLQQARDFTSKCSDSYFMLDKFKGL